MSSLDDDAGAVSTEAAAEHEPKQQGNGSGGPIILFFIIGVAVSLAIGWGLFPRLLYSQKKQPLDFNHKLHVSEVENGCESCHYFREDGSFSGIPEIKDCVACHAEEQGESADEAVFVSEYIRKEKEVPWLAYARQPDCVFFTHAAHVKMGRIQCETCHGHIGESESSRVYEQNRISGYSRDIWGKSISGFAKNSWDRMKMDDCTACHERMTGRVTSVQTQYDACFVCHK
jgi:menaquinone reductase, multiheme cytochrome c subunit